VSFRVYWRRGSGGGTFRGRVRACFDGDTMLVDSDRGLITVRIWGIDAPEPGQPLFREAREALKAMLLGSVATFHGVELDNYGRTVARVTGAGAGDVGRAMVAAGLAWWCKMFAPAAEGLRAAEREARRRHLGIWGTGRRPIGPWTWRRLMRSRSGSASVITGS